MSPPSQLSRRLYRSFGVFLILLLLVVGFSLFNFRRLANANAWNVHSYRVLLEIHALNESLYTVDSGVRGFMVSGKKAALGEFQRGLKLYDQHYKTLSFLTSDRLIHRQNLALLQKQRQIYVNQRLLPIIALRSTISDPAQGIVASSRFTPARRAALEAMQNTLGAMENIERDVQSERESRQNHLQKWMEITLLVGSLLSILLTASLATLASRSSHQLDEANEELLAAKSRAEAANEQLLEINGRLEGEIAQRRAAEEKLQQGVLDLQRSNAELEQFAYVASHDLQEPLRAVGGCVQLLQKRYGGQLDARADQFIGHAVEGAQRMQNLINDLLLYSRVGTKAKAFENVAGEAILRDVLQNISVSVAETGAQITHDSLPNWHCEASQIELVLQNLLSNAIKFRGEKPPEIHVGCIRTAETGAADKNGDFWTVSVADSGPGIESQYFERIFIMFQRLHTRTEYPGTGIGLAVCKKIVERHGGKIWLQSEVGRGTTFFFSLPLTPLNETK